MIIRVLTPEEREKKTQIIKKINDQFKLCPAQCKKKYFRNLKGYSATLVCSRSCENLKKIRALGVELEKNADEQEHTTTIELEKKKKQELRKWKMKRNLENSSIINRKKL